MPSFLLRLAKAKATWAFVSGIVTLIVIPIIRRVLQKSESKARSSSAKGKVVDAEAERVD